MRYLGKYDSEWVFWYADSEAEESLYLEKFPKLLLIETMPY